MSKIHGLIFSSRVDSMQRSSGAHRIATYLRQHDCDIEVVDFTPHLPLDKLHQCFYKGDIANTIIKYSDQKNGFLKKSDFEDFSAFFEKPVSKTFGNYTIYKTDTWGQGVTSLMMMAMSGPVHLVQPVIWNEALEL